MSTTKAILIICISILILAVISPVLPNVFGFLTGTTLGIIGGLGGLLIAVFVTLIVVFSAGILVPAIIGFVGVVLLLVAIPLMTPLLIVLIPIVLLLKLVSAPKKKR